MCAQHKLSSSHWKIQTSMKKCVLNTSCHRATEKYRRERKNVCPTQAVIKPLENTDVKGRMCAQHKLSSSHWKIKTSKEECVPNTSCHQATGKYRRQRKNVCPTQAVIKPVENTDVKGRMCA